MKAVLRVVVVGFFVFGVVVQPVLAASDNSFVRAIAESADIDEKRAGEIVKVVFSAVKSELKAGRDVTIREFGRFYVQDAKARTGRNPRSGEEIAIPARKYPRFKSSEVFKKEFRSQDAS